MCFIKLFEGFTRFFVMILLFLYKDSTRLLQSIYKVIVKILKCFTFFLYTVLTRLLRSWFLTFYKKIRFVFGRCFTRLLYGSYVFYTFYKDLNRLLQGFYKAFTQLSQGVYKTLQVFCTRFPHICLQCFFTRLRQCSLQGFYNVLARILQGVFDDFARIVQGL